MCVREDKACGSQSCWNTEVGVIHRDKLGPRTKENSTKESVLVVKGRGQTGVSDDNRGGKNELQRQHR